MIIVGLMLAGMVIWIGWAVIYASKMSFLDSFQELEIYETNVAIKSLINQSKHMALHPNDSNAQKIEGTANIRFCLELYTRILMLLEFYDVNLIHQIIRGYLSGAPLLHPDTQTSMGFAITYGITIMETDKNKTVEENFKHIDDLYKTCIFVLILVTEKVMPLNEKDEIFKSLQQSTFMKYHKLTLQNIKEEHSYR